jgi:fido (protein-threonine AMPylation protein)
MIQLTERQQVIADFIKDTKTASNHEIHLFLAQKGESVSRITLVRDLNALLAHGAIRSIGKGRNVKYEHSSLHPLLGDIDAKSYLDDVTGMRLKDFIRFNHSLFAKIGDLISVREVDGLRAKNDGYMKRISDLPPAIMKREMERVTIELSWKSSRIEGNTYSLVDTETLIKDNILAKGHSKEEAIMILNHKKALDYIFSYKDRFKVISLREVENVHRLLVEGLPINHGIRARAVGVAGTRYTPLDNMHQIREAMEEAVSAINKAIDPWNKALITLLLIAYIQPFEDGNKRTSRLIANACLVSHSACPISFRSVDESEYRNALLIFYEIQNAVPMKRIFLEQVDFAVGNYFL